MVESEFYKWLFLACVVCFCFGGFIFNLFSYAYRCRNRNRDIVKQISRIYVLFNCERNLNVSFFVVFLDLSKNETIKYYNLIKITLKNLDPNYYGNISYDPFESLDDVLAVCFPEVK